MDTDIPGFKGMTESTVEEAALSWFEGLGYSVLNGPDIAPGELLAERASYADVVLVERLRAALEQINPNLPEEAREEAIRKVLRVEHPNLIENNRRFHHYLVEGVPVEYQKDERTVHDQAWLIDYTNLDNNDWLVVNQFTVIEDRHNRRPDVVVFVNGLPLAVLELKNPADENATIKDAFHQFQTYKAEISPLFVYNEALVVSDGNGARTGTLSSEWERFMPWRTTDGKDLAPQGLPQLEVLIKGVFDKRRFLELIRHFIVFEVNREGIAKKMAGYHQFHAVRKAIDCTVKAVKGD
ncbi:MAG: type I restriction endonuclease, partial [Terriglobia bacterium]